MVLRNGQVNCATEFNRPDSSRITASVGPPRRCDGQGWSLAVVSQRCREHRRGHTDTLLDRRGFQRRLLSDPRSLVEPSADVALRALRRAPEHYLHRLPPAVGNDRLQHDSVWLWTVTEREASG